MRKIERDFFEKPSASPYFIKVFIETTDQLQNNHRLVFFSDSNLNEFYICNKVNIKETLFQALKRFLENELGIYGNFSYEILEGTEYGKDRFGKTLPRYLISVKTNFGPKKLTLSSELKKKFKKNKWYYFWDEQPLDPKKMKLTPKEENICKDLGFDEDVLKIVKTYAKSPAEIFYDAQLDSKREKVKRGICFSISEFPNYSSLVKLRNKLEPKGYLLFESRKAKLDKNHIISLIKSKNQYDIVKICDVEGFNHNLETEDIIKKIKEWEKKYSLVIIGAEPDRVVIFFKAIPDDLDSFVNEIKKFCPDVFWQNFFSKEEFLDYFEQTRILSLWWD